MTKPWRIEIAEIERAQQAQKLCETEHGFAGHVYDRAEEERS